MTRFGTRLGVVPPPSGLVSATGVRPVVATGATVRVAAQLDGAALPPELEPWPLRTKTAAWPVSASTFVVLDFATSGTDPRAVAVRCRSNSETLLRGLLDGTTIPLTADHGMEDADPSCTGDGDQALAAAGIPFRDEAYGLLSLGHS